MTEATIAKYQQHVLEISLDDGTTWARICGITNFSDQFQAVVTEDQIPDCDDESKPHTVTREVQSVDLTVNADAKWAQESHNTLLDWMIGGEPLPTRVGYLNAAVGDTEYVSGTAILQNMTRRRQKGIAVEGTLVIQFTGALTRTAKA